MAGLLGRRCSTVKKMYPIFLWQELLTESGATNLFIVVHGEGGKNELITPPTSSGLILNGVNFLSYFSTD